MKFRDKDFKEAVKWLKENNFPLDLTKHMIDFTDEIKCKKCKIIDLDQ